MDLIAPLIPNAQENKGPELFLQGMGMGLQAFSRMAQMRRDSEMEMLKLAEHERVSQEQNALEKEKMSQDYEIRQATLDSTTKVNDAHAKLFTSQADAFAEGTATSAQMKIEATKQKNLILTEVADRARELKLDDAHFQTKQPMAFAKNVIEFGRTYHLSPLPEVRKAIKDYQSIADSQQLFIKHGEEDESGVIKPTGAGRNVPAWRIVANANDPSTRDQTFRDLEASGYAEIVQGFQQFTDKEGKKVDVPTKTTQMRQPVRGYLEETKRMKSPGDSTAVSPPSTEAAPVETPMPDYGPDPDTPNYPIGTKGKRGGQWYVLTEEGWKPAVP